MVGRSDDNDRLVRVHALHLFEDCIDDFGVVERIVACRQFPATDAVYLIDEQMRAHTGAPR